MGRAVSTPLGHFLSTANPDDEAIFVGVPGGEASVCKRARKFDRLIETERVIVIGGNKSEPTITTAIRVKVVEVLS